MRAPLRRSPAIMLRWIRRSARARSPGAGSVPSTAEFAAYPLLHNKPHPNPCHAHRVLTSSSCTSRHPVMSGEAEADVPQRPAASAAAAATAGSRASPR